MGIKQNSGVRIQKSEWDKAESRIYRFCFSFILTPEFWILNSAFTYG